MSTMGDEKENDNIEGSPEDEVSSGGSSGGNAASRARNKTVMLTPEMAGQVRAQLQEGVGSDGDPVAELLPPINWNEGSQKSSSKSNPSEKASAGNGSEKQSAAPSSPPKVPSPAAKPPAPKVSVSAGAVSKSPVSWVKIIAAKESKIIAFFISYDDNENGDIIEIRHGRWLLTSRQSDHSEQIIIDDESISPLHAIIRATGEGKIQILDQLSEHGTGIFRGGSGDEIELAGSMETIEHGDIVRFGKKKFVVCLIPNNETK